MRAAYRTSVAEAAKAHKVSEATVYAWRKHFGAMDAVDVKRPRALKQEKARVKKLLAERDLDVEILQEINAKNGVPTGAARGAGLRPRTRPESASGL